MTDWFSKYMGRPNSWAMGPPGAPLGIHAFYMEEREGRSGSYFRTLLALCLHVKREGSLGDPSQIIASPSVNCRECLEVLHA